MVRHTRRTRSDYPSTSWAYGACIANRGRAIHPHGNRSWSWSFPIQYSVSDSCYYLHSICKHNNQSTRHVDPQWQRAVNHIQSADNEWHAKRQHNPQPRIATRMASGGGQSQTRSPTYFQVAARPAAHVVQNIRPAAWRLSATVGFQWAQLCTLGWGIWQVGRVKVIGHH